MPSIKLLTAFALSALSAAVAATLPARQECSPPTPGNYNIQVQSMPGELLGVSPTGYLLMTNVPPQGNNGVWSLTAADNAGFHIQNVGVGKNVTTLDIANSNPIAFVADKGTPATTYAIECSGGGTYAIKAVTEDLLWTMFAQTGEPYESEGYATVELIPATDALAQHFFLQKV